MFDVDVVQVVSGLTMRLTTCQPDVRMDEPAATVTAPSASARGTAPGLHATIVAAEASLLAIAERLCATPADARDLVQDTLERAMRQGVPADIRSPRAWLATVMHNLFIDRCRAAKRQPVPEPLDDHEHVVGNAVVSIGSADEPAWSRVTLDDVRAALDQIDPAFARVYAMHAFEHRSYDQIAAALAIERSTVGTRLNRARLKLRNILVKQLGLEVVP